MARQQLQLIVVLGNAVARNGVAAALPVGSKRGYVGYFQRLRKKGLRKEQEKYGDERFQILNQYNIFLTSSISFFLSGKIVVYFDANKLFSNPLRIYSAVISSFSAQRIMPIGGLSFSSLTSVL